jgi:hypothetical protein
MDYAEAIVSLCPDAKWTMVDYDYNQIQWFSPDIPQPTREQVEAKVAELKAAEPMRLLRAHRDKLLSEVDWITIRSYNQGVPVPEEWVQYCQALRDLPETAIPILDPTTKIGISGVDWPVKP